MSADLSPAAIDVLLALADDEFVIGHRHSEWLCVAPFLEEDLAFISIGQDELGHAAALYSIIGGDDDGAADRLAFDREPGDYRCSWLVEARCDDWADALVRHLLYDTTEVLRWEAFATTTVPGLASVAAKALAEEAYHTRHAVPVFQRVATGTTESASRIVAALERQLPLAVDAFEPTAGEAEALETGVLSASSEDLARAWRSQIGDILAVAGLGSLAIPDPSGTSGGRVGVRSDAFAPMLEEMNMVRVLDPTAQW